MDSKVVVLGDSHTYGSELPDAGLEKPWAQHSNLSWPYHMFDKDNIENLSYPGCSNDMISLRLLRRYRHAIKDGASKEKIVLIMFSKPERLHVVRQGCNFNTNPFFSYTIADNGKENVYAEQINQKYELQNRNFVLENFDDVFLEILFLKNVLFCQNFLDSNGIPYYFTMVDHREKIETRGSLETYRDSLFESINWNKIFLVEGKYGYIDYANKIYGFAKNTLPGNHYPEEYHKLFGNLFLDWIKNKNTL